MKSYSKAPEEVGDRVAHIIHLFHPELEAVRIRVDLISVANSEDDGPALTHQGYAAAAVVRIVDIKGRIMGRGDAEIVIDEYCWLQMDPAQKDALIDHELHHLIVQHVGKGSVVKLDERGRPKLKLRKHDRQFGWFDEIAKRHGRNSGEVKQAMRLVLEAKQIYFDFAVLPAIAAEDREKIITIDMVKLPNLGTAGAPVELKTEEEEDEELVIQATAAVQKSKVASVSVIQRRLRIGYNRAARIMDRLEQLGIVGPENGASPREILINSTQEKS